MSLIDWNELCETYEKGKKYDTLKARCDKLMEAIKKTCQMINDEGKVSKWKIQNWLDQALKEIE